MERQPLQDYYGILANLNKLSLRKNYRFWRNSGQPMPIGGVGLMQDDDIEIVRQWIADGTLGPKHLPYSQMSSTTPGWSSTSYTTPLYLILPLNVPKGCLNFEDKIL